MGAPSAEAWELAYTDSARPGRVTLAAVRRLPTPLRTLLADPVRRRMLLTGFATFVLIGAAQSMYGPAFPAFRARFGIGEQAVGFVVSAHFLGSFAAIALSGLVLARLGYRRSLVGGAACLAAGLLGVWVAPSWALVLVSGALVGVGFGLLDVGVNLLFVRGFERGRAPALNLLHAMFGVGAVLGPLLVGLLLPRFGIAFLIAGVLGLAVLLPLARVDEPDVPPAQPVPSVAVLAGVAGFALFYFLYVAVEVGVASWETEYLAPTLGVEAAAVLPALFWGALMVGRLVAAPLSARLGPRTLVLGSATVAVAGAAAALASPFAPAAYVVVGFGLAPIFPTGLAWLERSFPERSERFAPVVVAGASLGPVATAWLIGAAVEATSLRAVPWSILVLAGAMLAVGVALALRHR